MDKIIEQINENTKGLIKSGLEELPQENVDFFLRIYKQYGNTVDEILDKAPRRKLDVMARQIDNTEKKGGR